MKIPTVERNGITPDVIETVLGLVRRISWPERRQAMAEVTNRLLDGKPRVAEEVFGWRRATVEMGMNELRTGIVCLNDISTRHKPGTEIPLVYYPPYHSKYNSIEHYWGGLERSWNGYLLDNVQTVLKIAGNFVWRAAKTTVSLLTSVYKKGVTLCAKEKAELERRLDRSTHLPRWYITIRPLTVH